MKSTNKMSETILNGILCEHDCPVDEFSEINTSVLFLHNEKLPIGMRIKEISNFKKISFSYFVSEEKQTVQQAIKKMFNLIMGKIDIDISSYGAPYSEVTPDLCWTHHNEFRIGGHDMNLELHKYIGKWIIIRIIPMNN